MARGPIEQLIELSDVGGEQNGAASDARRAILRDITDNFLVAPDRYGRRDMAVFDLLLSRTAKAMDQNIRKLMAMTLVRTGSREDHIRLILSEAPSPNAQFLRRSVMQTKQDLLLILKERTGVPQENTTEDLSDGNSLALPSALSSWLYVYIAHCYHATLQMKAGHERAEVVARTVDRGRRTVIAASELTARDEIITARKTVRNWTRRQTLSDEVLCELLEARAMTEFILALSEVFDVDVATIIRILNDTTFESLAIISKANGFRRAVFAKMLFGFRQRQGDIESADRILGLYDKLSQENAERVVRFWRLRISDLGAVRGGDVLDEADAVAAPLRAAG